MYTGTQKKVIVLENSKNSIFEEAYFILKDDLKTMDESEMVREANKILNNNIFGGYFLNQKEEQKKPQALNGFICFLLGALFSFAICTLLFLFLK